MTRNARTAVASRVRRIPRSWAAAVLAGGAIAVIAALLGSGLRDWAVGLGMDGERGALIAALLEVLGGAAIVTLFWPRTGAVRAGALTAMLPIEVVPFLVRAGHAATPAGLHARVDGAGLLLQPLGMLLLGFVAACLGAGLGGLLHRDAIRAWQAVRPRPRLSAVPIIALALAGVAFGPAVTALQAGPVSALFSYDLQASPAASMAATAPAGAPASAPVGMTVPGPAQQSAPFNPGHEEPMSVDGRRVVVYVPGSWAAAGAPVYRVVYLLHGYPSAPDSTINGLQLAGVVDQLTAGRQLSPTLIVVPDGNGSVSADAEWGDTADGNAVETWLTTRVVPAIDGRYRTFGARARGVAGFSAGGFGAVNLALRHPDIFRWAASWSGYFEARSDIFQGATARNSPSITARALPASQRMPIYLGAGSDDAWFLADTNRFDAELTSLAWPAVHADVVPGGHSPDAWRDQMVRSFTWLESLWDEDACARAGGTAACRSWRNG